MLDPSAAPSGSSRRQDSEARPPRRNPWAAVLRGCNASRGFPHWAFRTLCMQHDVHWQHATRDAVDGVALPRRPSPPRQPRCIAIGSWTCRTCNGARRKGGRRAIQSAQRSECIVDCQTKPSSLAYRAPRKATRAALAVACRLALLGKSGQKKKSAIRNGRSARGAALGGSRALFGEGGVSSLISASSTASSVSDVQGLPWHEQDRRGR